VLVLLAVIMLLIAAGLCGMYCLANKRRHQIPTLPAHVHAANAEHAADSVVLNAAYRINTDGRAQTGNVVVTTAADQIHPGYLIPMVEQAPGEYMEAVARNQDYTYAPPMQPPADYEVIDEGGDTRSGADSGADGGGGGGELEGGGGGGQRKTGGGRNVDPNGCVLDASRAPEEPGSDGEGARNEDENGYVVDGSGGPDGTTTTRPIVYSSYAEGSTDGATNTAEYGTPVEHGEGVYAGAVDDITPVANTQAVYGEGVYGDDPYAAADPSHSVA
jgi:hypothetical protein